MSTLHGMAVGNSLKKLGIEQTFRYVYKDPEPNMRKLMDWADRFAGNEFEGQRKAIREVIENKEHPYHDFVLHLFKDVDQDVLTTLVTNFFINAALIGWPIQEKLRNELGCNIPWAILLDPTRKLTISSGREKNSGCICISTPEENHWYAGKI